MNKGIRFYNVVWDMQNGSYENSIEYAHSVRYLKDQIRRKEISHGEGHVLKVQEIETPMIEIEWLLKLFTELGNKKERESHADQAAYVLRLVENCAARVMLETGEVIER